MLVARMPSTATPRTKSSVEMRASGWSGVPAMSASSGATMPVETAVAMSRCPLDRRDPQRVCPTAGRAKPFLDIYHLSGEAVDMTNMQIADALEAAARPLELAIVLPTLNEKGNIAPMVARLEQALGPSGWEALFVDDNSRDGTADVVREIAKSDPRIRVIQRIGRRGLASAAIEGMCATAAPYVAVMDADHQHDPALLLEMLAAVKSGEYDLAYASRFTAGASAQGLSSKGREKGSRVANSLARRLTGTELSDAMSGYFLLRSAQLRSQADRLSGIGFKIMLDILATA